MMRKCGKNEKINYIIRYSMCVIALLWHVSCASDTGQTQSVAGINS